MQKITTKNQLLPMSTIERKIIGSICSNKSL